MPTIGTRLHIGNRPSGNLTAAFVALAAATLLAGPAQAETFISAEPIPSGDVVGQDNLGLIESIGYSNLERWSNRLLGDCDVAQDVIDALTANHAIGTIDSRNTTYLVAAGGFQAVTDPSYVFHIRDSGPGAATAADVAVLDNALGYVLNQGGTTHFSPDNPKAYDVALDYGVVTVAGSLSGLEAKAFFDYLGTIDAALWSGEFAGFTQIAFNGSSTDDSMLFLKPAASKRELIDGLSAAASTWSGATYVTLNNNGQPTTVKAGVSFPGNDWIAFPNGDQYLAQLGTPSSQLLGDLAAQRQRHLAIVADLVSAIRSGKVSTYLGAHLRCH